MKKVFQIGSLQFWWILALAFLSVGARNFEEGLSVDGPLYAAIARNIARTGEWFWMRVGLPEYAVYADHTHFGFWLHALWLKVFPAADWAIRIPSHLMYVLFLLGLWKVIAKLQSARAATFAIVLLWIWAPFSNYFSNFYLDPGALLSGSVFLLLLHWGLNRHWLWAVPGGVCLGICFGYKGLTALAFGPAAAMICFMAVRERWSRDKSVRPLLATFAAVAACFALLALYYWSVKQSSVPDFFARYWAKQMTGRFAGAWGLLGIFNPQFWLQFFKDTLWLGILLLPALWKTKSNRLSFILPLTLFLTVIMMYAPTDRNGGQYGLLLLPWAAWLIAAFLDTLLLRFPQLNRLSAPCIMKVTGALAIAIALMIQYLPVRTHSRRAPSEVAVIQGLKAAEDIIVVFLDLNDGGTPNWASAAPLAWYLDREIRYVPHQGTVPPSDVHAVYVLRRSTADRVMALKNAGWCLYYENVFTKCDPFTQME